MSTELGILALYGVLILITITAQALVALAQQGLPYLASARDENRQSTGADARLMRATTNSVTAMAYFAPAILILQIQGLTSASTLLAAQVFLIARAIYVVLYAVGVPWLRTVIWSVGVAASLYLYFVALI